MSEYVISCTGCGREKEVGERDWVMDICPSCSRTPNQHHFDGRALARLQMMECPVCRDGVDLGKEYTPSLGKLCDKHGDELAVMAREGGL